MSHAAWLEVDLGAVAANARALAGLVAPARLCAVVKSNAYGHGLVAVARALEAAGIEGLEFGVFSVSEAAELRSAGAGRAIVVLGPADEAVLDEAAGLRLEVGLFEAGDAPLFARRSIPAHVKIETGTRRFGMSPADASALLARAGELRLTVAGVYSHLANAEDLDREYTRRQLETLLSVAGGVPASPKRPLLHIAASAAAMTWPETRLDMVRCGVALYGAWPSPQVKKFVLSESSDFRLRPVLRWFAPIVQIKEVAAGEPVGYGCAYVPERDSKIAVLAIGYADGLPRAAGHGRFQVALKSDEHARFPIVGRICMNACMSDVTDAVPRPSRGDAVELDVEALAAAAGTINYEILARLSPALERRYAG